MSETNRILKNCLTGQDFPNETEEFSPATLDFADLIVRQSSKGEIEVEFTNLSTFTMKTKGLKWYHLTKKVSRITEEISEKMFRLYEENEAWWMFNSIPFEVKGLVYFYNDGKLNVVDFKGKEVRFCNKDDFFNIWNGSPRRFQNIDFFNIFVKEVIEDNGKRLAGYAPIKDL